MSQLKSKKYYPVREAIINGRKIDYRHTNKFTYDPVVCYAYELLCAKYYPAPFVKKITEKFGVQKIELVLNTYIPMQKHRERHPEMWKTKAEVIKFKKENQIEKTADTYTLHENSNTVVVFKFKAIIMELLINVKMAFLDGVVTYVNEMSNREKKNAITQITQYISRSQKNDIPLRAKVNDNILTLTSV